MNDTSYNILKLLVQQPINTKEILKYTNISSLTLKNNIRLLNDKLNEFNLPIILCENDLYTLKLTKKQQQIFYNSCTDYSQTQRYFYLSLKLLLENKINLEEIREELQVSRSTITRDIQFLKKKLNEKNIELYSIPWQGIFFRTNDKNNRYEFLCELFMKLYYEFEYLPKILRIYLKKIDSRNHKEIIKTFFTLYDKFNLQIGELTLNYLLALDICCFLFKDFYLKKVDKYMESLKKDSFFNEIYNELQKNYNFSENQNLYISMGIYFNFHQNPTIRRMYSSIVHEYCEFFELRLSEEQKYLLCIFIHFSEFRFRNHIYNLKNTYYEYKIDTKLLKMLDGLFKRNKSNILYGDLLEILNYTKIFFIDNNKNKIKKILILKKEVNQGYVIDLKSQLEKIYPNFKFEIRSYIYLSIELDKIKTFDFILSETTLNLNIKHKIFQFNTDIINLINEFLIEEHLAQVSKKMK